MSSEPRCIVLASRASQLAQIQTNIVLEALKSAFPDRAFSTSFMSTQGDKNQSQALYLLGGKSLWTKELEVALLEGEVDLLVHSLKDVPTTLPEGCALGAILEREHGEDCLVVKRGYTVDGKTVHTLDDLPTGAAIGTSSVRRVAQLKRRYPGLVFKDVVRCQFCFFHPFSLNQENALSSEETCASISQQHTLSGNPSHEFL
jgi:hydroxymethylbilane synthase